jgi:hypothetical protein
MLLLAMQCLLRNHEKTDNVEADARALIGLFPTTFDLAVLSYLRQYYNLAIDSVASAKEPNHALLAEWIYKAKSGEREYLLPRERPILSFYFQENHGWGLWLSGREAKLVRVPFGVTKLTPPVQEPLKLPAELVTAIEKTAEIIDVAWEDSVLGINSDYPFSQPAKRRFVPAPK